MKKNSALICFFVFCQLATNFALAQNAAKIDSLKKVLAGKIPDSTRVIALKDLSGKYDLSNPDTSLLLCEQGLTIANKMKWPKGIAMSYNGIANAYFRKGDYKMAMDFQNSAYRIWDSLKNKKGLSNTYSGMGLVYWRQSDYPNALDCFFKCIKIGRELNDSASIAKTIGNVGIIYAERKEFDKAFENYNESIKMYTAMGKTADIARTYGNIGIIFSSQGIAALNNKDTATANVFGRKSLNYYMLSLKMAEKTGDNVLVGRQYGNIAIDYWQLQMHDSAFYYFHRSLDAAKASGDKAGYANVLGNLGEMYFEDKNYPKAEEYLKLSLNATTELKDINGRRYALEQLAKFYKKTKDWKSAFDYFEQFVNLKDSIFNESKSQEIGRLEAKADYDQKQAIADLDHQREMEVSAEKEKQQTIISVAAIGALLIILVFSGFLYKRYKQTQKQKRIIEEQKVLAETQKEIIEEKQKEILDSIHYARRIQTSLLPTEKYIDRNIKRLKDK